MLYVIMQIIFLCIRVVNIFFKYFISVEKSEKKDSPFGTALSWLIFIER